MRLAVFTTEQASGDRIGRVTDDAVIDVTDAVDSLGAALERLSAGTLPRGGPEIDRSEVQFRPPTAPSNTVFAAALNYGSHIEEKSESDAIDTDERGIPETPYFFLTLYRALVGHEQPISYYASITDQFDFAGELAAVIGTPARNVSPAEALDHVAGYTVFNDTAAYDIQNVAVGDTTWIDWFSAKSMEATTPIGPAITPASEIDDPHDLRIHSAVNGQTMQDGSTASMIRGIDEQIAFLSTRVTLQPGDVIATGTPEGVGAFQDVTLANSDRVDIEIEDVGRLSNVVEEV
jgi:2-keto-4-pentenoate hydratase/2-oxohepta-3-ene-1,7-dioic acid hydratase in catechol pathway